MATKTFDELKQLAIQIRDEKTNKQNTANRVGAAMLEAINKLEQDYYDKIATDEELKERDEKLTELEDLSDNINNTVNGEYSINVDFESFQGYINTKGQFIPNINQRTTDFLDYPSVKYSVKCNISSLGAYINFYDNEKNFLLELSEKYKSDGEFVNQILNKPEEAAFYRITTSKDYSYLVKANNTGLIKTIYAIKEQQNKNTQNIQSNTDEIRKLKDTSSTDFVKINISFDFQGYINSGGDFMTHPNGVTTDYLQYKEVIVSLNFGLAALNCGYVNFYDSDHVFLPDLSNGYIKNETVDNLKIIMPEGASFMRITANPQKSYSAYCQSTYAKKRKSIDKNVNWVGHSIWWYNGNRLNGDGPIAKGYQTLLKEQFVFKSDTGNSYCLSGHSLGGISEDDTTSLLEPDFLATWEASENAIWTLDTITNDFKRNIPIGTIDDFTNNTGITTYYGALRVFKDKVLELSGEDAIVICSNALRRNNSGYTSVSANSVGHTLVDYEKALMTIAEKQGWLFVDQYRLSGITDDSIHITTIDGLHLNNFGYTLAVIPWIWMFDYIYNRSLFYNDSV